VTPGNLLFKKNVWEIKPTGYSGKKVLVTGACGSIGSKLARKLQILGAEVDGIDNQEGSVANTRWRLGDFVDFRPTHKYHYVFHAAAYKHILLGEDNPKSFYLNNVGKTVEFFNNVQTDKFVLVSTDKASGNSVMGNTKKCCEDLVKRTGHYALRLVNCAFSQGSVLDLWQKLSREDLHYCVDAEVTRYWMQLDDAVNALLLIPFQKPGLYTVVGCPKFTMGQLRESWDKIHGPCKWMKKSLHWAERKDERLSGMGEALLNVSEHFARII